MTASCSRPSSPSTRAKAIRMQAVTGGRISIVLLKDRFDDWERSTLISTGCTRGIWSLLSMKL